MPSTSSGTDMRELAFSASVCISAVAACRIAAARADSDARTRAPSVPASAIAAANSVSSVTPVSSPSWHRACHGGWRSTRAVVSTWRSRSAAQPAQQRDRWHNMLLFRLVQRFKCGGPGAFLTGLPREGGWVTGWAALRVGWAASGQVR